MIDLTWGESVCVRQAFLSQLNNTVLFGPKELSEMDYTSFLGQEKLLEMTEGVIFRQTGLYYKHIYLTNGAAGACTIALRAFSQRGALAMITNPAPYFALYPAMAKAANLSHITDPNSFDGSQGSVILLDTPSNPQGQLVGPPQWTEECNIPLIWDAVYNNNVYRSFIPLAPAHNVVCGSYSKLTGLNGIRIGWIATNDSLLAERIKGLITAEYCGLSKPSMDILTQCLIEMQGSKWAKFEREARYNLDANRSEWSKLERYFQYVPVPGMGMFYYAPMDPSCKNLIEKAGIKWMPGSSLGTNDGFGRFNLGQDPYLIAKAVRSVLKVDKI